MVAGPGPRTLYTLAGICSALFLGVIEVAGFFVASSLAAFVMANIIIWSVILAVCAFGFGGLFLVMGVSKAEKRAAIPTKTIVMDEDGNVLSDGTTQYKRPRPLAITHSEFWRRRMEGLPLNAEEQQYFFAMMVQQNMLGDGDENEGKRKR